MKKLLFFLLVFISVSVKGQVYQLMPQYGYDVKRMNFDSTLQIPTVCGVPTLKSVVLPTKKAAIAFDSCNNRFYTYNPKTQTWSQVSGGGSTPNLQQVTDAGATTTNTIELTDGSNLMKVFEYLGGNYNLLNYNDGLSQLNFRIYDSSTNSSGIIYNSTNNDYSYNLGVNSTDKYKLYFDYNDYSFNLTDNKIYFNSNNAQQTIVPITSTVSALHDTTYFPDLDVTKDTLATLRDVRSVNVATGLGSVYDTAGVLLARVRNSEATTLNRGEVVYIYGATGNVASVKRANNKQDSTSSKTFGVVKNNIAAGDTGVIVTQGQIDKLNLGSFSEGDILWLDSVNGQFTKTKPSAPYHQVFLGVIERANNGNGLAYIKVQNGYELNELHNVSLNGVANNQVLMYESSTQLWKNKSVYTAVDTSSLSNRINTKLNISDTATMLSPYLRKIDTASLSTRINTKLNITDTTAFDRKQSAAYTFRANNTNAAANMTDQVFRDPAVQTYSSGITWTGTTAPSGTTNHSYNWQRIGNMVTLNIILNYGTAGSALTQVLMALPADCPTPKEASGLGAATDILYFGTGQMTTATSASNSNLNRVALRINAADNGYEVFVSTSSGAYRYVNITVQYFVN